MRRRINLLVGVGLVLALELSIGLPAWASPTKVKALGEGPAYDVVGKLAVMHAGRIKPLDTVAREEVKHVFGRETIKLHNAAGEVVETWGPVGAFLDWMVRPEVWDDQPFILVDYLPLRRAILADTIRGRLKDIAAKPTTSEADRTELTKLAAGDEPSASALGAYVNRSKLAESDRKDVADLASKLGEEHKWLTPREIESAKILREGQPLSFMQWVSMLDDQKEKFDENPNSAQKLTESERRALDVGRRLMSYQAFSGEQARSAGVLRVMPRPSSPKALGYLGTVVKKAKESQDPRSLSALEIDMANALGTYWNAIPIDQRKDPGVDAAFDEKFALWLRENSAWVPLKVLLKAPPEELVAAGYPESETKAFLTAYHELEQAEDHAPGQVAESAASATLTTSRKLGEAVDASRYADPDMINLETHFNAMNPFWQAPIAYGAAVILLAVSLGFVGGRKTVMGRLGRWVYISGMIALAAGIALEVYGFFLRIRLSGWAPVTNMYETVIWVALVAAVLSFVFELIFRRTFPALAGSGVALLGTITAVNVPLLDPGIRSLNPVLRSNFWLTIHVLTEVSSYAAFGLAWALGLIALAYYLTAVYRRSPSLRELALPLIPGLPLLLVGGAVVVASSGAFGDALYDTVSQLVRAGSGIRDPGVPSGPLFYVFAVMGAAGMVLSLGAVFAMAGELANRFLYRQTLSRAAGSAAIQQELEEESVVAAKSSSAYAASFERGGVATLVKPTAAEIRAAEGTAWSKLDVRELAMQQTAQTIKPLANFIYRAMQVGVLLITAGTILGGVWADYSWGRFWGWDPKEVWALITLLVYLVPLHGRFAGWVNTFGLVAASIVCFLSVVMAWYGVNFVLGVGLHSYGFVEGGSQGMMTVIILAVLAIPFGAYWRRRLGYRPALVEPA
jgi:ABC-type transport system involved in cytochrome c biogenesis permease subunit